MPSPLYSSLSELYGALSRGLLRWMGSLSLVLSCSPLICPFCYQWPPSLSETVRETSFLSCQSFR